MLKSKAYLGENMHACGEASADTTLSKHNKPGESEIKHDSSSPSASVKKYVIEPFISFRNEVQCGNGTSPALVQLKHLELCVSGIKRYVNKDQTEVAWILEMCHSLARIIFTSQLEPKVQRKTFTVMEELGKRCHSAVHEVLSQYSGPLVEEQATTKAICLWCQLADVCCAAREIVEAHLTSILTIMEHQLKEELGREGLWTLQRQEALHVRVKMIVQILQHFPDKVSVSLFGEQRTPGHIQCWKHLTKYIIQVLQRKDAPKDSSLLAGTALALLLNLMKDTDKISAALVTVYNNLVTGASMSIGTMDIEISSEQDQEQDLDKNSDENLDRSQPSFGHMAFLNGVVSCASSSSVFTAHVDNAEEEDVSLAAWLFNEIYRFCHVTQMQYHAFRLLLQWFVRVQQSLESIVAKSDGGFLTKSHDSQEDIRGKSMRLVWTHLDSPVDGVNDIVIDVFKTLLKTLRQESALRNHEDFSVEAFIEETKNFALQMSWNVKGKHYILGSLLPEIDVKKFMEEEKDRLWGPLLECLGTNFLTPAATQLYKAFLQTLKSSYVENEAVAIWKDACMPALLQALMSNDRLLCHNACQFWLVWSVMLLPESYALLVAHLESRLESSGSREATLRALMALFRVGRLNQRLDKLPERYIQEALCHINDDLRLDAFAVICSTSKKSDALSMTELAILKSTLPLSINSDCPPFRQQLLGQLRVLLCRARDSSLAQIKSKQVVDHHTVSFLTWLWNLCLENLQPGASYQTLITCLEWMWVMLDCVVYIPDRRQKKGSCPENAGKLLQYMNETSQFELFTSTSAHAVLSCLLSGTQDVRETSFRILSVFFPWPLPCSDTLNATALFHTALSLCHSPRPQLSHSGAILVGLIFEKFVLAHGTTFTIHENGDITEGPRQSLPEKAALGYLTQLINYIKQGVRLAQKNAFLAAKSTPIHGFSQAIQQCLTLEGFWKNVKLVKEWQELMAELLQEIYTLMDLARQVLGAKLHQGQETAPSFEEMGRAIAAVISEAKTNDSNDSTSPPDDGPDDGDDNDNDETSLSPAHQLLMTWAWSNIKESALVMGLLVATVPCGGIGDGDGAGGTVLSVRQVADLGQLLYTVLTKCRHRGAIEGCNVGFARYCSHLLCDARPEFCALPATLLQQVLQQVLHTGASTASSVTRRSAGLPLIAQTILASESKAKQTVLLESTVRALLSVLERPLPAAVADDRVDLPHTHALNVLRALFREAGLAGAMAGWTGRAAIASIRGLAAPIWAIRNSAMQLFSTLLNRMVGQKKTKADHLNSMTAGEFFTHFPELEPFLLQQIRDAVRDHSAGKLHPSLFPVLSVLAKLGTGTATDTGVRVMQSLEGVVRSLASSPIYGVRELAAQALVPLVSSPHRLLLTLLPQLDKQRRPRMNWLHGTLLQMEHLIKADTARAASTPQEASDRQQILAEILAQEWLGRPNNPCHLVRAQYVRLVGAAARAWGQEGGDGATDGATDEADGGVAAASGNLIQCILQDHLTEIEGESGGVRRIRIGVDTFVDALLAVWSEHASEQVPTDKVPVLMRCLQSPDNHVVLTALKIIEGLDANSWRALLPSLLHLLPSDSHAPPHYDVTCHTLHLLLHLHLHGGGGGGGVTVADKGLYARLVGLVRASQNSRVAALALAVSAAIIAGGEKQDIDLEEWSALLETCSQPASAETLRHHAATALLIAGKAVLTSPPAHVSVLKCCVNLLVDEQTDTRRLAAEFVQSLPWQHPHKFPVLHPNFALEMLFDYWARHYCHSALVGYLFELLVWGDDVCGTLRKAANVQVEELFASQDINPYRQTPVLDKLATKTIMHLMSAASQDRRLGQVMDERTGGVLEQLHRSHHTLTALTSGGSPLLAGSCDSDGFRALHGLYHQAHVTLHWLRCNKADQQALREALQQHREVVSLHPALVSVLTSTLNSTA